MAGDEADVSFPMQIVIAVAAVPTGGTATGAAMPVVIRAEDMAVDPEADTTVAVEVEEMVEDLAEASIMEMIGALMQHRGQETQAQQPVVCPTVYLWLEQQQHSPRCRLIVPQEEGGLDLTWAQDHIFKLTPLPFAATLCV